MSGTADGKASAAARLSRVDCTRRAGAAVARRDLRTGEGPRVVFYRVAWVVGKLQLIGSGRSGFALVRRAVAGDGGGRGLLIRRCGCLGALIYRLAQSFFGHDRRRGPEFVGPGILAYLRQACRSEHDEDDNQLKGRHSRRFSGLRLPGYRAATKWATNRAKLHPYSRTPLGRHPGDLGTDLFGGRACMVDGA